jgi:hypothetical protein
MTRAELSDLFTPIYDQFAMMAFDELSMVHPKLFDVIEDPTKDYKYNAISGLGKWDTAEEDSDTGLDHFVIGYEGSVSQAKFRKYFYVSFEVNEQMEYASLKSKIVRAEALGRGGRAAVEAACSAMLYNGFATAGADGYYSFYDSHPKNPEETGTTYDNLLSGAFSHDNLEAAEKQISANYFDLDGLPIARTGKPILAYAPALAGVVGRVLSERAGERPSTTTRDINLYSGKYIPVEWDYLGAAMGGSDTAWYIIYPNMKMLKMVWGAKPQYTSWIDNLKQRYYFDGWEHFVPAITDWRFGFGSTGL